MAEMEETDLRFIKKEESTRFDRQWPTGERGQEAVKDNSKTSRLKLGGTGEADLSGKRIRKEGRKMS